MAEKKLNARVVHKHDIEENWLKATTFVPKAAEIIVYDPDDNYSYSRIKVGDGVTTVIDLPFSAGQADLMQNDPTAPDYIKGRTHWTDDPVTTTETEVIVEEQTVQLADNMYFEDGVWNLVLGETYTVTWDETTYECACYSSTYNGFDVLALGNSSVWGEGEDTGEPFGVGVITSEGKRGFMAKDNESHTVSIVKITSTTTQTVHMLDPKYYERIAWVESETEIFPETTIALEGGEGIISTDLLPIVFGETYTLVWDGVEYSYVAVDMSAEITSGAVMLGSMDSSEAPGCVLCAPGIGTVVSANSDTATEVTVSIKHGKNVVHTIDPMFLPSGVPYVIDSGMVEILPETTLQGDEVEAGFFYIATPLGLTIGERYTVHLDGVEYEGMASDGTTLDAPGVILANDGADFTTGEGVVFAILELPPEYVTETGYYAQLMLVSGATSCTISIYQGNTIIQKLDVRCLPDTVPYVIEGESTNTLTFDGDFAGKESLDGMMVKVSDNIVSSSDLEKVTAVETVGLTDDAPSGTFTEFFVTDFTADGVPALILGSSFEESELPLMYIFLEDYSMEGMSATKGIYILGVEGSCYVSKVTATSDIFGEPDILNKLDPVLLPDNVPYLIEGEDGEVILEETTGMPDYDGIISAPTFNVIPDKTVIVTWNGTDYECLVYSLEYNGTNFYAFGNSERIYALYGATVESNNVPFAAFSMPDGSMSYVMAEDNSTEVTVSIRYTETPAIIQKLDNRCLDLEWYADKPTVNLTEIYPEATVSSGTIIFAEELEQIPVEVYQSYPVQVMYDGTAYDTFLRVQLESSEGDGDMMVGGNLSLVWNTEKNTGEPFVVLGYYNGIGLQGVNDGTYSVSISFADGGTHTISISLVDGYTYNTIPKEYLPDLTSEIQETLEPIKNQLKETMLVLTDTVNGYEYIIQMQNGNLISICKCGGITITSMPTKTEYNEGDTYDLSGLAVTGVRQDGEVYEIEGWIVEDHDEVATLDNYTFYVSYTEHGETFTTSFDLTVIDWGAVNLTDFTYTKNSDGTYTITDWKGTLNGEASTEMIVPDSDKIII